MAKSSTWSKTTPPPTSSTANHRHGSEKLFDDRTFNRRCNSFFSFLFLFSFPLFPTVCVNVATLRRIRGRYWLTERQFDNCWSVDVLFKLIFFASAFATMDQNLIPESCSNRPSLRTWKLQQHLEVILFDKYSLLVERFRVWGRLVHCEKCNFTFYIFVDLEMLIKKGNLLIKEIPCQ